MRKKYRFFILAFVLVPALTGCKKYLDIKPEDKYTDEQVFSSESTIRQALNGIYNSLSDDALYGAGLTLEAVEIIGQRYDGGSLTVQNIANTYMVQGAPGSTFDALWTSAYALVLSTNNFIGELQKIKGKGIVSDAHYSQLLGEAIAVRAFIQFDILRLYGPQYAGDGTINAIPYYTKDDGAIQPILKFSQVIDAVLIDLSNAEQLLANDPVIINGVGQTGSTVDFYAGFRNRRMNYYAVKALEARVCLYAGKSNEAHAAAKEVIDIADTIFPWTAYSAIFNNNNPDRVFSSEVIFGIYNPRLYNLQNKFFSSSLLPQVLLAPNSDQLAGVFEYNENDYRYTSTWLPSSYGFRTFYKFADLPDQTINRRFFQPLIRKTEMYYILAETDPDPAQGVQYLNIVRYNRGLQDLPVDAPLTDYGNEIEKEYNKEFYGEGQLFFYYKRINPWWLYFPSYSVPFPVSETQLRK